MFDAFKEWSILSFDLNLLQVVKLDAADTHRDLWIDMLRTIENVCFNREICIAVETTTQVSDDKIDVTFA